MKYSISTLINKYIKIGDSNKHWDRPEWNKIKQKVWNSTPHKYCWLCAKPYNLQFHHLSYAYNNTPEEWKYIVILCKTHHYLSHYTLFTSKIPLLYPYLHARYIYLKKNRWRRIKPNHIFYWLIKSYSINGKTRGLPYFDYPFKGVSIG